MSTLSKVGLVNGCFDLFHPGHAWFLWVARQRCTYLIAGVNTDESVRQLKGPTRPFDNLKYRMDRVSAYASMTVPFDGDAAALIREFRPDVVIRGWDQVAEPGAIALPRYGDLSTTSIRNG